MAQSNEDQPVRSTGRVVRFADRKGFGFIKPDDGGEDLFVHYSNIVSEGGFRSLTVDESVEFTVVLSDSKYQATNVTAVGGGPISAKKPEISNKRGGGYGGGFRRNGGGGGYGACYNCGNSGHIARDCNANVSVRNSSVRRSENSDSNNGGGGSCFECGETGHYMRDCPNGNGNVGGGNGGGACYKCGAYGHLARECRNSGGGGGGACYNCGGLGHLARDCTSARGSSGRFGGGGGGNQCFHCGKEGHFARDCPNTSPNTN